MKKILMIIAASFAAANCAYAAMPESSKGTAADGLSSCLSANSKCGLADSPQAVPLPPLPSAACRKPPVYILNNGNIYREGTLLGRRAANFRTGCTDNVAWLDKAGYLYRNTDRIGHDIKEYEITAFTGDAIWTDSHKFIYRNQDRVGSAVKKDTITAITGDLIFTDSWDYLYKSTGKVTSRIGSDVKEYKTSSFTGSVAWLDNYNYLYKTTGTSTVRLGSAVKEFSIASVSGDVAWRDGSGCLYKNNTRLTRNVKEYRMNARGQITWKDSAGDIQGEQFHYSSLENAMWSLSRPPDGP